MKIIIQATKREKRIAAIVSIIVLVIAYLINRRYLFILDAEFENGQPKAITLKTGFIIPVKKYIRLQSGESGKVKFYGYKYKIVDDGQLKMDNEEKGKMYSLYINNKKAYTIYPDEYYGETKKLPTGRIYI